MNLEGLLRDSLPEGRWRIFEAMRYTPLAGGKRLRARVLLEGARDIGVSGMEDVAIAVELFHSGTLIHDDLPEIDDAALRRGKPANHIVFGQGMALLAGDGLFFKAFELVSRHPAIVGEFSSVALRVLIGEAMDVEMEERDDVSLNDILEMYDAKTGALFGFSFCAPALEIGDDRAERLRELGTMFGRAFQMFDDLKDVLGSEEELGKDVGKDVRKKTVVKIWGIEKTSRIATEIYVDVVERLGDLGMVNLSSLLRDVLQDVRSR